MLGAESLVVKGEPESQPLIHSSFEECTQFFRQRSTRKPQPRLTVYTPRAVQVIRFEGAPATSVGANGSCSKALSKVRAKFLSVSAVSSNLWEPFPCRSRNSIDRRVCPGTGSSWYQPSCQA